MKNYNTERKRLRLSGYDYSSDGYYFVTVCTQNSECLFGNVQNGIMGLNKIGCIVAQCWQNITKHFFDVWLDAWVVMPNHVHGVVVVEQPFITNVYVGDADLRPLHDPIQDYTKTLLPKIIHGFKSSVTRFINKSNPYTGFKWQRSYYDHIIRNDKSLDNICNYIQNNPQKWEEDVQNQKNQFSNLEIKQHYDNLFK